jgi:hypothetical protein
MACMYCELQNALIGRISRQKHVHPGAPCVEAQQVGMAQAVQHLDLRSKAGRERISTKHWDNMTPAQHMLHSGTGWEI